MVRFLQISYKLMVFSNCNAIFDRSSRSLFLQFRVFNDADSNQVFNINFADDWIGTADLWCWNDRSTNWTTALPIGEVLQYLEIVKN